MFSYSLLPLFLSFSGGRKASSAVRIIWATSMSLRFAIAGEALKAAEGFVLVEAGFLHEDSLGALDDLAIFEGLAEVGGFLAQRLELLEPPDGDGDGRFEVGLLDRFDEEGQDMVALGALGSARGRGRRRRG